MKPQGREKSEEIFQSGLGFFSSFSNSRFENIKDTSTTRHVCSTETEHSQWIQLNSGTSQHVRLLYTAKLTHSQAFSAEIIEEKLGVH